MFFRSTLLIMQIHHWIVIQARHDIIFVVVIDKAIKAFSMGISTTHYF